MINTLGPSKSGTLWVFNTLPSPLLLETLSDALTPQGPALSLVVLYSCLCPFSSALLLSTLRTEQPLTPALILHF